jgi:hypothetical protein
VAVLISQEEERRAFIGYKDALALLVAPPLPSGPPPMQPPRTPPARPRREARAEPWDAWPRTMPAWLDATPLILGWAPGTLIALLGSPPPPMADWSWPQGPFIDLSGDDDDE